MLSLTFTVIDQSAGTITTPITFSNTPVACDVVNVSTDELPATFTPGNVTIFPNNAAPYANSQSVTTAEGHALPITLTGSDPNGYTLTIHYRQSTGTRVAQRRRRQFELHAQPRL